jgi:hypothetical protein
MSVDAALRALTIPSQMTLRSRPPPRHPCCDQQVLDARAADRNAFRSSGRKAYAAVNCWCDISPYEQSLTLYILQLQDA